MWHVHCETEYVSEQDGERMVCTHAQSLKLQGLSDNRALQNTPPFSLISSLGRHRAVLVEHPRPSIGSELTSLASEATN